MSAADYTPIFQQAGQQYNIDPDLLVAMTQQESRFNPTAVSPKGATGLMQLMPGTAKDMGVSNVTDPQQNIMGGARYLRSLIDKYGDLDSAVMAYNWGPANYDKFRAGQIKTMPTETSQYLDKVSGNFGRIKGNAGFVPAEAPAQGGEDPILAALSGKGVAAADPIMSALSGGKSAEAPKQEAMKAPAERSMFDEAARQVGLTARAGINGIAGLPAMMGDALNTGLNYGIRGVNSVAGSNIPELQMPSQALQSGMNAVGIPQPENKLERVVQDATSAMASVVPSVGLGNVLSKSASPVTAAVGRGLTQLPGMQVAGAAGSGAGAGTAREAGFGPVGQIGGALAGGAGGALASSAATSGARALESALASRGMTPQQAQAAAQVGVSRVLEQMGDAGRTVAPEQVAQMENQLAQQIMRTGKADPSAMMRAQDFSELGISPTLGQVTRDAGQFAKERNVRGLEGLGERLMSRFEQQNQQLQSRVSNLRGNPLETFQAGDTLSNALKAVDDRMRGEVTSAYRAAKQSSGKDLNVPLSGLAQDYANVVKNFAEKVPGGVRNQFESLGLNSGTQRKTFSVDDAENLLKVINDNMGADRATNTALGQLRDAVKNAVLSADDQGGVYAGARKMAAQRFQMQEAIPALKAASEGSVAPDDFVRRFVVGGKTNDVKQLAGLLQQNAPEAFQEARAQIGNELSRAAFGSNVTGDMAFSPARYAEALRKIGTQKLGAFYSPDEVAEIQRIGRVGSYINSQPAGAPVNNSNTAGALASMLGGITSKTPIISPLGDALKSYGNRQFVNSALEANLPKPSTTISPEESALATRLMLLNTPPRNPTK